MSRKCGGIDETALVMMVAVVITIATLLMREVVEGVVMAVVVAKIERKRNRTGMGYETELNEEGRKM